MLRHRKMLWLFFLAGWVVIGLIFTLNYYLFADHYVAIFKKPPTWKEMLVWELPYWIIWAALSPLIFWITRRFRVERQTWLPSLLLHLSACLLVTAFHRAIYLLVGWLLHVTAYQQVSSLPELYQFLFFFNLPTGFTSYGAILIVSYLVDFYYRYQDEELKASRLKAELTEAQLQVTQAQLQALKMQLHPHFLFNTLNSISALLDEDIEAADEMLARLGNFLRLTLENSGAQEVSLQQELEFLGCYLDIERVRFQDRLSVRTVVEPETLDARVPNLILQPIVENAIRHGIVSRISPGELQISARQSHGVLQLQVKDNGPGLRSASGPESRLKEGVGIKNTLARLKQLYGSSYRFEMNDVPEGGLQVTLEIPFETVSLRAPEQKVAFG